MKVIFVCSSFGGGGAEKVAVKLSSALAGLGHDVTYVYWKSKQGLEYKFGANVDITKIPDGNLLKRAHSVSRLIRRQHPDVVISFTDLPNIIAFFSCLMSWPYKCIRVPNVRTNVSAKYSNLKSTLAIKILSYWHGVSCRSAPIVLVNSKDSGNSLCGYYGLNTSKVHCIYNPVFDVLPNEVPDMDNPLYIAGEKIKAINVGRLTQAKDQKVIVRAIDHAVNVLGVDIVLDIYGEGELHDELQSEINRLGLESRVFLRSFDADIESKIKNYHVFLFASRWEGLPNALIEALGSGIEVISTDCPSGPREILDGGRFGSLVEIGNHRAMAEAISQHYPEGHYVASKHARSNKISDELKEHLQKFTISFVASQYVELISRKVNEQ